MTKYKKRKDGRYLAQVQIGYQDNGNPKYKNIYGRSVAELDKKLTQFKADLYKGIIIDDKNVTMGEWAEYWLEAHKNNVIQASYLQYESIIKTHLSTIKHIKIGKIKLGILQELLNSKAGKSGIKAIAWILKDILQYAVKNELIHKNPMDFVIVPKPPKSERRALTQAERTALTEANLTDFERSFVYLCLHAGLRRGEALALMRNDIDFKRNVIRVKRTLTGTKGGTEIKNGTKTKAGERDIPLIEPLKSVLERYTKQLNNLQLFTNRNGKPIANPSFDLIWKKILSKATAAAKTKDKLAVIEDITPHYLRHTYATDLYYAGIDIKTCQYLLGHSAVNITMDLYTHLDKDRGDVAQKLESYINKNQSVISQSPKNAAPQ